MKLQGDGNIELILRGIVPKSDSFMQAVNHATMKYEN